MNPFADFPVIFEYTRKQAIEDGELVDVTKEAEKAGFRFPVALSRAAYEQCVAWNPEDNERQVYQDVPGRLWDVLWMLYCKVRSTRSQTDILTYELHVVPRDGKSTQAKLTKLKSVCGPGDAGEPVITIMLPDED